jgi:hypothetical protein
MVTLPAGASPLEDVSSREPGAASNEMPSARPVKAMSMLSASGTSWWSAPGSDLPPAGTG